MDGNVGIGTTSPWRKLSVTGTVGFDGLGSAGGTQTLCLTDNKEVVTNDGACTASSEELKHGIAPLALSGADIVSALLPAAFTYTNADRETWASSLRTSPKSIRTSSANSIRTADRAPSIRPPSSRPWSRPFRS